jgi:hypothetical protein
MVARPPWEEAVSGDGKGALMRPTWEQMMVFKPYIMLACLRLYHRDLQTGTVNIGPSHPACCHHSSLQLRSKPRILIETCYLQQHGDLSPANPFRGSQATPEMLVMAGTRPQLGLDHLYSSPVRALNQPSGPGHQIYPVPRAHQPVTSSPGADSASIDPTRLTATYSGDNSTFSEPECDTIWSRLPIVEGLHF